MKKFAVVLSGCGVYDGAELHEAILTLLAIDRNSASYDLFAPDILQHHVVDHLNGNELQEKRNVLTESARIARGNIRALDQFCAEDYDALIFPGGFGVAKNLISWAIDGDQAHVEPSVEKAVHAMRSLNRPIGAMCIAPILLAKLIPGSILTTGNDPASGDYIRKNRGEYVVTSHGEVVSDLSNKLFTTPCYMLDATISDIEKGTNRLVLEMLKSM